jgi:hypothetical protein
MTDKAQIKQHGKASQIQQNKTRWRHSTGN